MPSSCDGSHCQSTTAFIEKTQHASSRQSVVHQPEKSSQKESSNICFSKRPFGHTGEDTDCAGRALSRHRPRKASMASCVTAGALGVAAPVNDSATSSTTFAKKSSKSNPSGNFRAMGNDADLDAIVSDLVAVGRRRPKLAQGLLELN